jgi:hypothetical protein
MLLAKLSTKSSRFKRFVAALLLTAVTLAAAAPAWAAQRQFIGDEPADQNNLTGDVVAERQMESFWMPLGAGSSALTASVGAGLGGTVPLAAALLTSVSLVANYDGLAWKNWPMGRYLFWHYPPDKMLGFLPQMSGITLWVMDTIANGIFSITKYLVTVGINVMFFAFDTDWLAGAADWVGAAARSIFSFDGRSFADVALKLSIILFFVLAMQKLLAGQLAGTVKSLLVAVLSLAAVFLYTLEAPQIIRGAISLTDGVAGVALSASAHFFWEEQNPDQFKSDLDRGLANAGTAVWQACVAEPWAAALFGTSDPQKLKITADEWSIMDKSVFQDKNKTAELDKKVQDGTLYADTLFLACGDDKSRDAVAEMLGRSASGGFLGMNQKQVDHGQHPGSVVGFAPSTGSVLQHVGVAVMTVIPAFAFLLLVAIVGGMIILSQLMLTLLLIFAPAALFAAMVPDAGWALAARYFKTMLAFLVNKLIFGVYLGGLLAVATGVVRGVLG